LTVADVLMAHRPFVVAFSTPLFCQSRMCGPVTDVVAQAYERHRSRAEFIHIEPFDLPTARTQGRLALTPVAQEWRLPSEPWVFVVGADGKVAARFEGLVTLEELSAAVEKIIQPG
jgi:hypothetical protein